MKRRDFLKLLGACVVAPGTAIAMVKAKPKPIKFGIPYWVGDTKFKKLTYRLTLPKSCKLTYFNQPLYYIEELPA